MKENENLITETRSFFFYEEKIQRDTDEADDRLYRT